ncbi:MAG: NAD(P)-dependent oxidoreductase [Candidatus Dadabacteria bacterium]|nr:MAG: NAD(P)-dependent oxidoreductase [Candidatus Dadabacteria bacterium]
MEGRKILITGATGQVAWPILESLAGRNEVFALARFTDESNRQAVESLGAHPIVADLGSDEPLDLPQDLDYVLHFANSKDPAGNFDRDLRSNVEGVGRLMAACAGVRGFFFCSSAGVYAGGTQEPLKEDAPLGDSHRPLFPTYSICKIAAEAMVRFACRHWSIPSVIARLSVPYGERGGWPAYHLEMILSGTPIPIPPGGRALYNPLHERDYVAQVPALLAAASVPALVVNWGGSQVVALEDWCAYLAELAGKPVEFVETETAIASIPLDTSRLESIAGPSRTDWREGMRAMVRARHPELEVGGPITES